jgi:hypothetical protein
MAEVHWPLIIDRLAREIQTLPGIRKESTSGLEPRPLSETVSRGSRSRLPKCHRVLPRPHLESDSGRNELTSTRLLESEAPRQVTDGLASRLTAADGAKDLADQPLDAG